MADLWKVNIFLACVSFVYSVIFITGGIATRRKGGYFPVSIGIFMILVGIAFLLHNFNNPLATSIAFLVVMISAIFRDRLQRERLANRKEE